MVTSKKSPRGRQTQRSGATPRANKKARREIKTDAAETCQATTVKGAQCRLKPREGSAFCARHADQEASAPKSAAVSPAMKNGQKQKKPAKKRAKAGRPAAKAAKSEPSTQSKLEPSTEVDESKPTGPETEEGGLPEEAEPETGSSDPVDPEQDPQEPDYAFYGSEFSTTLEASPYDDLITPEMAEGEEDVELRDEKEFGRDQKRQPRAQPPRISREEAVERAKKRLGPRPTIAPEEDLDGTLAQYDRRFEDEVRRLLGIDGQRKRGRRGGRRRKRGGGPPGGGGGGGGGPGRGGPGGGGGRRRGRRGGQGRQGGGGRRGGGGSTGGGPGTRSEGPSGSAARKVARDGPLAQRRSSKGPKRGVQPRRRREPDV